MIAGVDISTKLIAAVILRPADGTLAGITTHPLAKVDTKTQDASARCRDVALGEAAGVLWAAGVTAAYIEQPMGRHVRSIAEVERVIGAFIASLHPSISVSLIGPPEWKAKAGMPGNAGKPLIADFARLHYPVLDGAPQDVCDAACIARAAFNEASTA